MNSRRNVNAACSVLLIAGLLLWLLWPRTSEQRKAAEPGQGELPIPVPPPSATPQANAAVQPAITPPSEAEIKQKTERQWSMLLSTPISVYGKVVDENGNVIAGAKVEIGITDRAFQTGSAYSKITDEVGLFSLTGVHGIAFSVSASKKGYYSNEQSMGRRNVTAPSRSDLPQPSKGQPVVLVLHKQGQTVPLNFTSSRQIDVPRSGQPISIDLATGKVGQGNLQVTSWLGNTNQRPFDWRYQLSVPGGGLVERTGQFDFEAPADGYLSAAEINMPTTAEKWSARAERQYFAKLPDGRYARFLIRFYPNQQRNFVVLESHVNPTAGDRNLEFDPGKQAAAP